jgi:geranylgeranyl pyrophosphate synthase
MLPSINEAFWRMQPQVDVQAALATVRPGLRLVEQKMKDVDGSHFAPLTQAFVDLIGSGGKRLRPALALMAATFNHDAAEQIDSERILAIAAAVETLHTASLVHDDVVDGALLRRGSPTLNAAWDTGSTVLAGNFMFGQAASFAAETKNMRVINIFSDTLRVMVQGELDQIAARFNYTQEKDAYYQRIYAKTASLFCAATESAAILSALDEKQVRQLRDFGYSFGMAFQIMDDILDFTSNEKSLGKPVGSDLAQGTLTLPFFYYLKAQDYPDLLVNYLLYKQNQAEEDGEHIWREIVADVAADIVTTDAIEKAKQEIYGFLTRAQDNLTDLPDNEYKQAMLDLCAFVVQRSY